MTEGGGRKKETEFCRGWEVVPTAPSGSGDPSYGIK